MSKLELFLDEVKVTKQILATQLRLLVYFNASHHNDVFDRKSIKKWFSAAGLKSPSPAYLSKILERAKDFEKVKGGFRFLRNGREELVAVFSGIESMVPRKESKIIPESDSIIPLASITVQDDSIIRIVKQINACFDNACFDACAAMVRFLVEVLLIRVYKKQDQIQKITSNKQGYHKPLSQILDDASQNLLFPLKVRKFFAKGDFVKLGNYAIHESEFLTQSSDIDRMKIDLRLTVQTLIKLTEKE